MEGDVPCVRLDVCRRSKGAYLKGATNGAQFAMGNKVDGGFMEKQMEVYFDRLWPICRSIMGPGYRESLKILAELMPVHRLSFKTGQKVLDWVVPDEWSVREAFLIDPKGRKRADFKTNNLHLVNYSAPFKGRLTFTELRPHIHSLPDMPYAIPYLTSYYKKDWGFCVSHEELKEFPEGIYEVVVDTTLSKGVLEIGEAVIPGETKDEILFSSYLCHPALANNELSGPLVMAFLFQKVLALSRRRYTYRFVVCPETIGSISYLKERGNHLQKHLSAGYQITCVGDPGKFTYKQSRQENTLADRAALAVLKEAGEHQVVRFDPSDGSDERQYCSPGFNLPMGSLMRTMYGKYPEYHTSLDNKSVIQFSAMARSVEVYFKLIQTLEGNGTWKNTVMYGEPQLGRRGLYHALGSQRSTPEKMAAILWSLNLSDGSHDCLSISERSGLPISAIIESTRLLFAAGLLKKT